MPRDIEAIEGLAVVGHASLGALRLPTPGLLAPGTEEPSDAPTIALAPSDAAGVRGYTIREGTRRFDLRFEVPTPELTPGAVGARTDGTVVYVHGPCEIEGGHRTGPATPELVVLSNARALFREGAPFVEAVGAIRRGLGARPLLWAPRVALPHRVALLAYLGVDLLDTTEALVAAADGREVDAELGDWPVAEDPVCGCGAGGHRTLPELQAHAHWVSDREVRRVRAAARAGRLRELVESRLPAEPLLAELLRYADRGLADLFDQRTPVAYTTSRSYVLRESFRRPEASRFRARFLERYAPPPSRSVLVLVPCSKTKPYRNSRSHRRFAAGWDGLPGNERLHVVSVTSPLGLVPRELEDLPPARHYDIPVTGEWDEGERGAVLGALHHLLARGKYRSVVVHLDPAEYAFLAPMLADRDRVTWTLSDDRTTSPGAIESLRRALTGALEDAPTPGFGTLGFVKEDLRTLATVQMGPRASESLLAEPMRLHGRPWFQRISDGRGTDLASWREERGLFQITVGGGLRLGRSAGLTVDVAAGVELRGDLFCPGIARADRGIRAGDAVVLYRGDDLLGVGEAALPGPLMEELGRGVAVWVRHRVRAGDAGISSSGTREIPAAGRSSSG